VAVRAGMRGEATSRRQTVAQSASDMGAGWTGLIPARAWHRPGQPIGARRPVTERLTGGSHSSVNFSK
jgi:hypothetical protein